VLERPKIAADAGASGAAITASFDEGSLLLRDSSKHFFRLAWEARKDEARSAAKARTIPAGEYALVGYRIVDRSREGEVWFVAGSGAKLRTIEVPASGELRIEVGTALSVNRRFDGKSAGMEIRGADEAGVSIYKNGKRIPIGYRVLGKSGEELARGKMNYG
jgi:hypothetical protein